MASQQIADLTSLWIGNLDLSVDENDILQWVRKNVDPNESIEVRVCYDYADPDISLGHGYINFQEHESAQKFLDKCNYTKIQPNQKPIRMMWSSRKGRLHTNPEANIFLSNLPPNFHEREVLNLCKPFGEILSCRTGKSRINNECFGYVQFSEVKAADAAIEKLNNSEQKDTNGTTTVVTAQKARQISNEHDTCIMSNLPDGTTEVELRAFCEPIGKVNEVKVIPDRHFGFVRYNTVDLASNAVEALNGKAIPHESSEKKSEDAEKKPEKDEPSILVKIAYTPNERKKYKKEKTKRTVFIRIKSDEVTEDQLNDLLRQYGEIQSCKILKSEGKSKGFAFCTFKDSSSVAQAIDALKNSEDVFLCKVLSDAERAAKNRKRALNKTKGRNADRRGNNIRPRFPGVENMNFPFQFPPNMFPAGFFPGMNPAMMPPNSQPKMQASYPSMGPDQRFRGALGPNENMRAGMNMNVPMNAPFAVPLPYNTPLMNRQPMNTGMPAEQPPQVELPPPQFNIHEFRALDPQSQKQYIGEFLFSRIDVINHDNAPKITGMLLELDNAALLELLQNEASLQNRVTEALNVLRSNQ